MKLLRDIARKSSLLYHRTVTISHIAKKVKDTFLVFLRRCCCLHCWNLAFDQDRHLASGGCTPEMTEKDPIHILWKDMAHNESIREQTNKKLGLLVQERRLRWMGHVQRTSDDRIAKQLLRWIPEERRKWDRQHFTWQHVTMKDTEMGGLSWEEAFSIPADRREWKVRLRRSLVSYLSIRGLQVSEIGGMTGEPMLSQQG